MKFVHASSRTKGRDRWFSVSDEDFMAVTERRWHISYHGYPMTTIGNGRNKLSCGRFLLGITDPAVYCDHINGDVLDNTRENLRRSTNSQNQANRLRLPLNTSGFKGVTYIKHSGKWQAGIKVNGRSIHLGWHETPAAAAEAYAAAAREHFGDFARPVALSP